MQIVTQDIQVASDIKTFKASIPNFPEKYKLPYVKSEALVQRWHSNWTLFQQNQLNFALWCAISGCGVDVSNHLQATGLIGAVFRFMFIIRQDVCLKK